MIKSLALSATFCTSCLVFLYSCSKHDHTGPLSPKDIPEIFQQLHPGYYSTDWNTSKIYWRLDAPADSTLLHPLDLLTSLKSKLLADVDLTSMKIEQFSFY